MNRKIVCAASLALSALLLTACGSAAVPAQEKPAGAVERVYLAGPFFNDTEIKNIEYAETVLTQRGLAFFSPMRHTVDAEAGTTQWANAIFELDRSEIEKADAVLALYYGNYGDTGTAWECGYAAGKGIPVILVHVEENSDSNVMMHCGAATNISLKDLPTYDFAAMPVYEYTGKMF